MIIKVLNGDLYHIDFHIDPDDPWKTAKTLADRISELSPDFHRDFILLTRENGQSFHPWECIDTDDLEGLENDETLLLIITTDVWTETIFDLDEPCMVCRFKSWHQTDVDEHYYEFEVRWAEPGDDLDIILKKIEEGVDETCDFPPIQRQNVIDELSEELRNGWQRNK